jgi:hypothetical protein
MAVNVVPLTPQGAPAPLGDEHFAFFAAVRAPPARVRVRAPSRVGVGLTNCTLARARAQDVALALVSGGGYPGQGGSFYSRAGRLYSSNFRCEPGVSASTRRSRRAFLSSPYVRSIVYLPDRVTALFNSLDVPLVTVSRESARCALRCDSESTRALNASLSARSAKVFKCRVAHIAGRGLLGEGDLTLTFSIKDDCKFGTVLHRCSHALVPGVLTLLLPRHAQGIRDRGRRRACRNP